MNPDVPEGVKSPEIEVRRKTALAMADHPSKEAIPHLDTLLGDPNWRVRKAAVESLITFPPEETLPGLMEALYDPDNAGRRNSAIEALTKIGQPTLPSIYEHILCEDPDVKLALLELLGEIPSKQSAPHLVFYLNNESKNLVSASISSIGKLKDPGNLRILFDLMGRSDDWLRFHLVEAFSNIAGPEALQKLVELYDVPRLRKTVLQSLGRMGGTESVPFILERLNDDHAPIAESMSALGKICDANIPEALLPGHQKEVCELVRQHFPMQKISQLAQVWDEAKISERRGMILVAGFLSELSLVQKVISDLSNPYLQRDAFRALQLFGHSAVNLLLRRLNSLPSIEERVLLIQLLALSGSEEAVVPLISQAREDDLQIRMEALQALGNIEDQRCVNELVSVLREEEDTFHEAALGAVRNIMHRRPDFRKLLQKPAQEMVTRGEPPVRRAGFALLAESGLPLPDPLLPGLSDGSPAVRQAAVNLVAKAAGDRVFQLLVPLLMDEEPRVRKTVIAAIGKELLEKQPDVLQTAMTDGDVWVRAEAAFFLAQSPDRETAEALLLLLENDQLPARVAALKGLAEVGCGEFWGRVASLARSDSEPLEIRQAALYCVAKSGREGSSDILVESLKCHRWEVRSTAIHLIGESGDHRYIPQLLKEIERDSDQLVRQTVIEALIKMKASQAVPRMLQYLTDPSLKDAAFRFFISLGKKHISLIEIEAQSVDFQTKLILIEILKHLENS